MSLLFSPADARSGFALLAQPRRRNLYFMSSGSVAEKFDPGAAAGASEKVNLFFTLPLAGGELFLKGNHRQYAYVYDTSKLRVHFSK